MNRIGSTYTINLNTDVWFLSKLFDNVSDNGGVYDRTTCGPTDNHYIDTINNGINEEIELDDPKMKEIIYPALSDWHELRLPDANIGRTILMNYRTPASHIGPIRLIIDH